MENIISDQLNKRSKSIHKMKTIAYYETIPLKQIHMDTFFYRNDILYYEYPFLIIVDVATKYINIIPQKRKNENIVTHVDSYCKKVQLKFNTAIKDSKKITIITDGAKEFNVLKKKYNHKVSVSINKAAMAESYIARVKFLVRKIVLEHYIKNIYEGEIKKIPESELLTILATVEREINKRSKIETRELVELEPDIEPDFKLGDAVFIKSNEKFYEQLRKFKKKSYLDNFIMEPFYISDINFYNGVYKYAVSSFFDHSTDKYWHYKEEIQKINPESVEEYINNYKKTYKSKDSVQNSKFIPK